MPSQREHRCPHNGKQENRYSKSECDDTHPALLELCRGVGEEKHCGEQNSIREVLTGNTPGTAGLLLTVGSFRRRVGPLAAPLHLVNVGHKPMGISVWIFKRLLCQPCVVGLAQLGRKAFDVKVHELVVARLMRSKRLYELTCMNGCLLHALHRQQTGSAFESVKFIHQPIALSSPRG